MRDAPLQPVGRHPVRLVAPLQVAPMCGRVAAALVFETGPLRAADLHPQRATDVRRHRTFHRHEVGRLAVVLRAPELPTVGYVDELDGDQQAIAALDDSSDQDGSYLQ